MAKAVAMLVALALVLVAVMTSSGGASPQQQCNPEQLAVCVPAIIGGSAPTGPCCDNLRAQEPCFCEYARNPAYSKYVKSPNARRTLTSCGIAIPDC